jgi:NlpB/DapX lipoprotein
VSWQKYAVAAVMFPALIILNGCNTGGAAARYRDTTELERPPQLEITPQPIQIAQKTVDSEAKAQAEVAAHEKTLKAKGLGDIVKLDDDTHLIIERPFADSWLLLAKGFRISGMEVYDRDLDKGQYYVIFDPDTAELKNGEALGLIDRFFIEDEYPKARYLITIYENKRSVKLEVTFVEYFSSGVQTESPLPDKGVAKLVKKLYTALHDDLPI